MKRRGREERKKGMMPYVVASGERFVVMRREL